MAQKGNFQSRQSICVKVAALVQSRCEILSDLPERVDFIDKLPDYEPELYIHKKSKTNLENSLETLDGAAARSAGAG